MKSIYQVKEYGSLIAEKELEGYVSLPKHTFEQLENFILTTSSKEADALDLMGLSARKGIGKVITAKNYVGLISMNDGSTIEILPKVFSAVDGNPSDTRIKKLLVNMLKTLRDSPYKSLQTSNVDIEKMNIFEIFIRMFVDEVFSIVKRGLKCNYETVEENSHFFRGKIKYSQQIKLNHIHKERSFVEYDTFSANRPENRLLKSTLQYLYRYSTSTKNRNDLKVLLNSFADVDASVDYESDFTKYVPDRNMKDYTIALRWCRIFLMGKSFTSFSGSEIALVLLFPMETLFESYVATLLKKKLCATHFSVSIQDKSYHLFDAPGKKFLLKPDIVIRRKTDRAVFIMDTKWKMLSDNKPNYGISQTDMYQMYAYHKKYHASNVTLLYPLTSNVHDSNNIEFLSADGVIVKVLFVDLFDITTSIDNIVSHCCMSKRIEPQQFI